MDGVTPGSTLPSPADLRLWRAGERWDERLARAAAAPACPVADVDGLLADWRRAVDADASGLFARRLAAGGLDERSAAIALTDNPALTTAPAWWPAYLHLGEAVRAAAAGPADDMAWLADTALPADAAAATVPFIHLWWLATQAWPVPDGGTAVFTAEAISDAHCWLAGRLSYLSARALMELFAAGRDPGLSLKLALGTEPVAAERVRYAAFVRAMAAGGLTALSSAFPVLPRLLATTVQAWSAMFGELGARLQADAGAIAAAFGAALPLRVLRLTCAGDAHRGGRMVTIVTLAGTGDPVRVVYKPKDMRLEQAYHRLATDFAGAPPVPVLAVGESYGYAGFVAHRPVADAAELPAFYRHAGRLLALLQLLGATDCHAENLIAGADRLVLIDPETLFDSRVKSAAGDDAGAGAEHDDPGMSVLRVGLLPAWQYSASRKRATDISALGIVSGADAEETAGWINCNTDAMAWGWRPAQPAVRPSLPVAAGEPNPLAHHVDALVDGFCTASKELLTPPRRQELATRIAACSGLRRRTVLRATRIYAILEQRLLSPDCLRSAAARGIELERMARGYLLAPSVGPLWDCYGAELHDLEALDIPYFDHVSGSRDLYGGGRCIRDVLADDGLAVALARVRQTGADQSAWQAQLIRAAVGVRTYRMQGVTDVPSAPVAAGSDRWRDGEQEQLFAGMLDVLERNAVTDGRGRLTWLSFGLLGDGMQAGLGLMDDGFYSGRSGLVAFLSALAHAGLSAGVTARAAALTARVWQPLGERLAQCPDDELHRLLRDRGPGLTGVGGFLQLLSLPGIPATAAEAEHIRVRLLTALSDGLVSNDVRLDVIGGAAGAVGPVADLCDHGYGAAARAVLHLLAGQLLARQNLHSGGWLTASAPRALTGYAHGASGIGLALLRAGAVLTDERYIDAGARAFAYEQALFDAHAGNWPDLRSATPTFMNAWCHGAAGIGLARGRALELFPGHPAAAHWREELHRAGELMVNAPPLPADHLCCGNAGRAAILRALGLWTGEERYAVAARQLTGALLAHWRMTATFRFNDLGTGTTVGMAGLMTGLPGIGMHLLDRKTATARLLLFA